MKKVAFVTGSAGFIGFHLSNSLLSENWKVVGLDAFTEYYDVDLKKNRNKILKKNSNYNFHRGNVQDQKILDKICNEYRPSVILHLAAQAGVRYSLECPKSYMDSNIIGTFNILELARKFRPLHLLIASTSSVYGNNECLPFDENQKTDNPISFYASTKKANEVMAHSYSHLYNIPITMLRFFTVYGPWGRPDMALFKFTENILSGKPIDIFNKGNLKRDFTYILDIVEAIKLIIKNIPLEVTKRKVKISCDSISNTAPYRIINIGHSNPIRLMDYINELELSLGIVSKRNFLPMQPGDMLETNSKTDLLNTLTGFRPKTTIKKRITINCYSILT